jgi:hypothetical protein
MLELNCVLPLHYHCRGARDIDALAQCTFARWLEIVRTLHPRLPITSMETAALIAY